MARSHRQARLAAARVLPLRVLRRLGRVVTHESSRLKLLCWECPHDSVDPLFVVVAACAADRGPKPPCLTSDAYGRRIDSKIDSDGLLHQSVKHFPAMPGGSAGETGM